MMDSCDVFVIRMGVSARAWFSLVHSLSTSFLHPPPRDGWTLTGIGWSLHAIDFSSDLFTPFLFLSSTQTILHISLHPFYSPLYNLFPYVSDSQLAYTSAGMSLEKTDRSSAFTLQNVQYGHDLSFDSYRLQSCLEKLGQSDSDFCCSLRAGLAPPGTG